MTDRFQLPGELLPHIPRGIAEVLVAIALIAIGTLLYREFAAHLHPVDVAGLYGIGFVLAFAGMLVAGLPVSYAVAWALLASIVLTIAAIGGTYQPSEEL